MFYICFFIAKRLRLISCCDLFGKRGKKLAMTSILVNHEARVLCFIYFSYCETTAVKLAAAICLKSVAQR